jgi:hypothetical protein
MHSRRFEAKLLETMMELPEVGDELPEVGGELP